MEVVDLGEGWRLEKYETPMCFGHAAAKKGCIVVWYDGVNVRIDHRNRQLLNRVVVPATVIMELLEFNAQCVEEGR
jgi:hypothetical protein